MRKSILLAGVTLLLLAFSACITERSASPVEDTITIPNALGFGGTDDGLLVQFARVENNSRCAAGVQCVRAGEAFVVLRTTVDGGQPEESRLEMTPGGQAGVQVDRFTVTILELRPDPPPVGGVTQAEYEVLVRIEEK